MKTYALTGGIATGKSTLVELLCDAIPDATLFDADISAREHLQTAPVITAVAQQLGPDLLTRSNTISRDKLRDLIFADPAKRQILEDILHPLIRQECLDLHAEMTKLRTSPLFIADVPLLFENGTFHFGQEHTLLVATTRSTQIDRLKERNGFDDSLCEAILASQWPIEKKIPLADTVFWNEGPPSALKDQVRRFLIHQKLMSEDHLTQDERNANPPVELPVDAPETPAPPAQEKKSSPAKAPKKSKAKATEKPADEQATLPLIREDAPKSTSDSDQQDAPSKKEKAPVPEDTTPVPDQVHLNELRKLTHAQLYETASALPIRLVANSNKAQLTFAIISYYLTRGTNVTVTGILEQGKESFAMLRNPLTSFKPAPDDIYLGSNHLNDHQLQVGQQITGTLRPPRNRDKFISLEEITEIDGHPVADYTPPVPFEKLTSLFPEERFILERAEEPRLIATRLIDLVAPIGKGQRGLIIAPPRGGKTILLKQIAKSLQINHPETELIVLLLDERPEEVTDFEEIIENHHQTLIEKGTADKQAPAQVLSSTFDEPNQRHAQVSDLSLEHARRLVEQGKDVVILLDSLTRLGRGYNNAQRGGAIGSGGLSPAALQKTRAFFSAARNVEEGGSLTIIATCLVETENRMDDIIFEELKGTGNMEIKLDQEMAEKRIYPAIHIAQSGTRNDDRLYHEQELPRVLDIRRQLSKLPVQDSLTLVLTNLFKTNNNAELLLTGLR